MGMNTVLNLLVTMLWLTGVCSAMNALDHMDGLAAGVSIIAAAAYLLVSIQTNQTEWALMSLALVGALTGFLLFNKPPARVFMGDSGSFFLGFALATIGIMGGWSSNPLKAAVVPISVLSMPIFDLCHVLLFRHLSGTTKTLREAIVYCGKDHIGHRLRTMGFSRSATLVMVCFIATTAAISALVIRQANYLESTLLLIQIAMIYITLTVLMEMARRRQNNEKKCD
jgi:UDP-N-acetylmuramyl pentapeptide phosphotransferase/UDP-N-acetylglucosamine-1-phosphate transferase